MKARDLLALALILVTSALPVGAQPKRDDPVQAEQRKLQETQNQLKQEREKAAEARRRETSLLAEIEDTERRLAQKQRDVARLDDRIKRARPRWRRFAATSPGSRAIGLNKKSFWPVGSVRYTRSMPRARCFLSSSAEKAPFSGPQRSSISGV